MVRILLSPKIFQNLHSRTSTGPESSKWITVTVRQFGEDPRSFGVTEEIIDPKTNRVVGTPYRSMRSRRRSRAGYLWDDLVILALGFRSPERHCRFLGSRYRCQRKYFSSLSTEGWISCHVKTSWYGISRCVCCW